MLKTFSPPEKFVALALLALGLIACLTIPLSAGYDEETHFIRAWEMAHLYFVPNEQLGAKLPFPALYWELSYRRQPIVDAVAPGFWAKYGALRMDAHDYVYANLETRSVYSPLLLLPPALALRYLGLSLNLPALAVYYACRLVGLLSYLILSLLAVRLIPYGKWLLALLVVSPMAVFQASTISADTISNGIGFLFLGASLAIAARQEIGWKEWIALLGLIALLFVAKVNLIFLALLPFLLISPTKFKMRYGFVLLAIAALSLFLLEVGGWNLLAYSKFTRALEGANPREQLLFIAANPLLFVKIIANDIWTNTPAYMQGWVGVYGYNYWPVPALAYLLYPAALLLSLWHAPNAPNPDRRTRIVLASLFVVGYLLTIVSLYIAFTPVRSLAVAGVQGRYFTVVMPLLFLALASIMSLRGARAERAATKQSPPSSESARAASRAALWPVSGPIALASSALVLYMLGLILSYHVHCGSEYYRWSLCYQPQYKNWAPASASSPPISSALTLTQEIVPACNDMTELSVWVNSNGTNSSGTTTLTLRAPTEQKDLVQQTFANADISPGGWLTVRFPAEVQSDGQLYLLKLTGSSTNGIQVGYSEKADYLKGKLSENETPISQDILFQYGCIAGLQKWWNGLR